MVTRYFRRRWNESRGDAYDAWGGATYWFETDEHLVPVRQIEVYDEGQRLMYSADHVEDEYGMLSTTSLRDWEGDDPEEFEVSRAEFEGEWDRGPSA